MPIDLAAVVGVGPEGRQAVVAVVEAPLQESGVASLELTDAMRLAAGIDFAAVLVVENLPVDIRHNSKIDRQQVAKMASEVLAGHSGTLS